MAAAPHLLAGVWPPADDAAPEIPAVRVRQVATLSRQAPMVALPSVVGVWLTVLAYAQAAPPGFLLAWAGLLTLAAVPPVLSWWRHRRRTLPGYVPRRVLLRSIFATVVVGLLWGVGGWVLFGYGGLEHRSFLTFMLGGLTAGAVASLSVQPGICLAFIVPTLLPLLARFALSEGVLAPTMAVMVALYLAAMIVFVRNGYHAFLAGVAANLERDSLRGALHGVETRLVHAVESFRDGFALHDARDRLVLCNSRYLQLFGTLPGFGVTGRAYEEDLRQAITAGRFANADDAFLASRLARRRTAPSMQELQLVDGRWLLLTETRTIASGVVSLFTDITELKAREAALEESREAATEARETAEVASRAKSEFLANMSHELRTPLNAIIGFSQIALADVRDQLPPVTYRDYARDVLASARHLLSIINDILDISKLEAGRMALDEGEVSLAEEVSFAERMVSERAAAGGVAVTIDPLEDLPPVLGDARALRQAVLNLLSNAVKFTDGGGHVLVHGTQLASGAVSLRFADTGIGMKPADIPKALAPFTQIDSSLSRRYEGTGLGLPLAKSMIELHGGTLEIDSELGVGTTVTITLPPERTLKPRR
jgi:signal transduction histidine kinase